MSPEKWSIIYKESAQRTQATPTQNTWYSLYNNRFSIGVWNISYKVNITPYDASAITINQYVTLSTANNTESDVDMTTQIRFTGASAGTLICESNLFATKIYNINAKTYYYMNTKTSFAGLSNITFDNAESNMILSAVCAYL